MTAGRGEDGDAAASVGRDPLLELPLFKTLLALLINLENPWPFSSAPPPDPPGAEELIVTAKAVIYLRKLEAVGSPPNGGNRG
jgi:hypothetical protein